MITTSDPGLAAALKSKTDHFPASPRIQIARKIFDTFLLKALTTGIFYPLALYPLLRWWGYLSADNRRRDFLNFIRQTKEKDLAFKFSDLQAAAGLSQLRGLSRRNHRRRLNSFVLRKNLSQKTMNKLLPWDGTPAHVMLHDAIVLERDMEIVKKSLQRGLDLRLDYCCNCRSLPGMEDFPGEDSVARDIDARVFFIPNHLGMNADLSQRAALVLEELLSE
jgi:hypothetical protein